MGSCATRLQTDKSYLIIEKPLNINEANQFIDEFQQQLRIFMHNTPAKNLKECGPFANLECYSLKRIIAALEFYSQLYTLDHPQKEDIFIKFTNNIYWQLLDDYIHLK
eukprot:335009_1